MEREIDTSMRKIFDLDTWREVFHTLRNNRKRTITTALGVFWGIMLLIILLCLGYGFNNATMRTMSALQSDGNLLLSYTGVTSMPYKGFPKWRRWHYRVTDKEVLLAEFPEVIDVKSIAAVDSQVNVASDYNRLQLYNFFGSKPDFFDLQKVMIKEGRLLNEGDELNGRRVCIIGYRTAEMLFPNGSAIGQTIRVGDSGLLVVGIIAPMSENMNFVGQVSRDIYIPLSLHNQLFGNAGDVSVHFISYDKRVKDPESFINRLDRFLRERYDVDPNDKGASMTLDVSSFFKMFDMIVLGIFILVWIVGIGTLIAGIVGVSNIMLVTVRERIREIGVRRAIGARAADIRLQIMLESFTITFLAGVAGMVLALLLMLLVNSAIGTGNDSIYRPLIPLGLATFVVVVVACSGLLAGLLPTSRALKINTIQALQEE